MAFAQSDIDNLRAQSARMCAVCNRRPRLQVHHIVPRHSGGSDDVSNAIPLCPNCHDDVHAGYALGTTTRAYTERELRGHLERTIKLANRQERLVPGNDDWNQDVELLRFYANCLDRPAFRTRFHNELSFADFDQALEDTVLALNTGLLRTRDGTFIDRAAGKRTLVNAAWRDKMDDVVGAIVATRHALRQGLGLDQMLISIDPRDRWLDRFDAHLRSNIALANEMDSLRQRALDVMNEILGEPDLPRLKRIGEWN